jgi:hypothetical protein
VTFVPHKAEKTWPSSSAYSVPLLPGQSALFAKGTMVAAGALEDVLLEVEVCNTKALVKVLVPMTIDGDEDVEEFTDELEELEKARPLAASIVVAVL